MLTHLRVILCSAILVGLPVAIAHAMDEEAYEAWVETCLGPADGSPVYWWRSGLVTDADTGEVLYIFEYYDVTHQVKHPDYPNKRVGLTRKYDLLRDKDTHGVLTNFEGKEVKVMLYPYQMFEVELKDGKFVQAVTQGSGEFLRTHHNTDGVEATRVGDFWYFTTHMSYNVVRAEYPDMKDHNTNVVHILARADQDTSTSPMHQWTNSKLSWREELANTDDTKRRLKLTNAAGGAFARFEELPQHVREYVESELPAWKTPPRDLAEVRKLQAVGMETGMP